MSGLLEGEQAETDEWNNDGAAEMSDHDDDCCLDWRHFFNTFEVDPVLEVCHESGSNENGKQSK